MGPNTATATANGTIAVPVKSNRHLTAIDNTPINALFLAQLNSTNISAVFWLSFLMVTLSPNGARRSSTFAFRP